jgi:hypothetical protein
MLSAYSICSRSTDTHDRFEAEVVACSGQHGGLPAAVLLQVVVATPGPQASALTLNPQFIGKPRVAAPALHISAAPDSIHDTSCARDVVSEDEAHANNVT